MNKYPRNQTLENTLYYIENYLNPDMHWNSDLTARQRIHNIKHAQVEWGRISRHINGMSYQQFLKTPYWKAITAHVKYKAGYKCQLCNSSLKLVTHHRNYAIHGHEHAHLEDLIALCDACHNKFHDTTANSKRATNLKPSVIILAILSLFFLLLNCTPNESKNSITSQNQSVLFETSITSNKETASNKQKTVSRIRKTKRW